MNAEILIKRNKQFVLDVLSLCKQLPNTKEADIMSRQLIRSASSTAANYRAACRARSKAEFVAKLGIVVEEIDESNFWLDLIIDSGINKSPSVKELLEESLELLKIYSSSRKSAKN